MWADSGAARSHVSSGTRSDAWGWSWGMGTTSVKGPEALRCCCAVRRPTRERRQAGPGYTQLVKSCTALLVREPVRKRARAQASPCASVL